MPSNNQINVTVVVNGKAVPVTVNPNQKLEHLVREALKQAVGPGTSLDGWLLKSGEGQQLVLDQRVEDAGIEDGAKLFLNKDEGGGG